MDIAPDPSNDLSDSDHATKDQLKEDNTANADNKTGEDEDFQFFAENAKSTDQRDGAIASVKEDSLEHKKPTVSETPGQSTQGKPTNEQNNNSNDTEKKRYVTPQDFELLKCVGMGAFGKVLQVKNKQSKQILAMKIISKRLINRKTSYVENIHAERDILTKIRHPFVVTMHCSFQTKEKLFIIMDFLAGGELFLRLGREGIFLESTAQFYIGEIVLALEHLHSRGILHRDLKPENILLGTDGHCCLTDFGLAKDFQWEEEGENEDEKALTVCGTQEYMAPEMIAKKGYTKAADWWSLGCIAYEMLSGNPPFESKKGAKDLFRKIMNQKVKMPDGSSAGACKLLKGFLNRNASARLGAAKGTMFQVGGVAQVKEMQFFEGLDWILLEKKEIDPPMTAHVDNDEDLRHFYDEFTQMTLPRSVKMMTEDDFKPKNCQSEHFKGFSFIQHDFELPERTSEHLDHYWNNPEGDGESLSECASMLEEPGKENAQMKPTLESTPEETPVKKKRPPRKKKKKGQISTPHNGVATDASVATNQSDAKSKPTDASVATNQSDSVSVTDKLPSHDAGTIKTQSEMKEEEKITKKEQIDTNVTATVTKKKVQEPVWETVKVKPTSKANPIPQAPMQQKPNSLKPKSVSLSVNAKTWTPVSSTPKYTPVVPNSNQTFPGRWAQVGKADQSTPKHSPASGGSSSDWRHHRMNPSSTDWRNHQMPLRPQKVPVRPQMVQPSISDQQAFPSLGDFPSLGGNKEQQKKITPAGSWSAKSAAPQVWGKKTNIIK